MRVAPNLLMLGLAIAVLDAATIAARGAGDAALTGTVTTAENEPMEGVLVSAKRDGSTATVTVVSDQQGRYSFPAAKLVPGHYALRIRAAGYDLSGPQAGRSPRCCRLPVRQATQRRAPGSVRCH